MNQKILGILLLVSFSFITQESKAQDYQNYQAIQNGFNALDRANGSLFTTKKIAESAGGKDISIYQLDANPEREKSAILVVGSVKGPNLLGRELVLQMAQKLINGRNQDSIKQILDKHRFYFIADLNPDASEQYFASLRYERHANARETDKDRDGKVSEDPYEDLNGDGMITHIRIFDESGDYAEHPVDPSVMVKADPIQGLIPRYRLITEGIDNDKDGHFNEDGEGGIDINKNFTFQHPTFASEAGDFAASEKETRGILDHLFDSFDIHSVITLGGGNNLTQAFSFNEGLANQRVVRSPKKEDHAINSQMVALFKKHFDSKTDVNSEYGKGDFIQWAYYHYGRFSYASPGWIVPKAKPDSAAQEQLKTFAKLNSEEYNFLSWATNAGYDKSEFFVDWQEIDHPDFPNQRVEVGGMKPFVMENPPYSLVDSLSHLHLNFLLDYAALMPELRLRNLKVDDLGDNTFRLSVQLINTGFLPTTTIIGQQTNWVKNLRIALNLAKGQEVLGGKQFQMPGELNGGDKHELSWIIKGKGTLEIEAGSMNAGKVKENIKL
ncbi:MAG: M14 family metallopeptidase [Cyclobacteriaceae bacterium]|nr:peptidase [Cyclobacteriaceae bacterium]MCH8516878.1 M14 family metallopeptidase [Cyclobacteriaceae bacterium]